MNDTMDVAIWQVLTAVGAVLGAVVGWLVGPWLTSLVPDGGSSAPRWFLRRPAVGLVGAVIGVLSGVIGLLFTGDPELAAQIQPA